MDTSESFRLIIIFILITLSAFFSSAETAFISVNKIKMQTLEKNGSKRAKIVNTICQNTDKMLSAILIGNNIVNLSASAITTTLATDLLGSKLVGVATGILTLLILIFGEITPKTFATIHSEKIALIYSYPVYYFMFLFTPLIFIMNKLCYLIMKILRIDINKNNDIMTEDELKTIVDVSLEDGVIEDGEHKIINNVFDFDNNLAKDIMIPKINIVSISEDENYKNLIELFKQERYTRIPVYRETSDNIIGVINIKDLLLEDEHSFKISNIMRTPIFTYEFTNISNLFKEMKSKRNNIAIVLDEYGVAVGLITMEDIVEEIVGDIQDEYDMDEENNIKKIKENEYLIDASINIDDVNEQLDLNLESEDCDSLGGIIIENLGRIPQKGEKVILENCSLIVEKMDINRIENVKLILN